MANTYILTVVNVLLLALLVLSSDWKEMADLMKFTDNSILGVLIVSVILNFKKDHRRIHNIQILLYFLIFIYLFSSVSAMECPTTIYFSRLNFVKELMVNDKSYHIIFNIWFFSWVSSLIMFLIIFFLKTRLYFSRSR